MIDTHKKDHYRPHPLSHGVPTRALKVDLNFAYTSTSIYLKALHLAWAP